MKRTRWVFGAVAMAGVVVLVAPAVGQGKGSVASLGWSLSRGAPALTSYDFGAVDGGAFVSRRFRLGNSSLAHSGKLAIRLTGSSAFSIIWTDARRRALAGRRRVGFASPTCRLGLEQATVRRSRLAVSTARPRA